MVVIPTVKVATLKLLSWCQTQAAALGWTSVDAYKRDLVSQVSTLLSACALAPPCQARTCLADAISGTNLAFRPARAKGESSPASSRILPCSTAITSKLRALPARALHCDVQRKHALSPHSSRHECGG
eukprot:3677452-Rhodomonas_salina.3